MALCASLMAVWARPACARPPAIERPAPAGVPSLSGGLPRLRPPAHPAGVQSALAREVPAAPTPQPAAPSETTRLAPGAADVSREAMTREAVSRDAGAREAGAREAGAREAGAREAGALRAAMSREVGHVLRPSARTAADTAMRAAAMLAAAGQQIDAPQLVAVVNRSPAVETLTLMVAQPGGAAAWRAIGMVHVSTGQAKRKDYYITPIGVFPHTDAILDFRAAGTRNEHHVRGLGLAGMRVWDFGWQWALKGWHTDGAGGDIRLQMHATDPDLLERKLGHPASEGCVRLSSSMNRFMDRYGVLDVDYERAAAADGRYANLLSPNRTPSPLAGRLLIVIDTSLPPGTPPTAASRPADWPTPDTAAADKTGIDSQPEIESK